MNFQELNTKYYDEFARLLDAQKFLTEKQYNYISGVIFKQYQNELNIYLLAQQLENGVDDFELAYKVNRYVPIRRKFWGLNKIGKRYQKLYNADFSKYLLTLSNNLSEMKNDIKKMLEQLKAKKEKAKIEKGKQKEVKALALVSKETKVERVDKPVQP